MNYADALNSLTQTPPDRMSFIELLVFPYLVVVFDWSNAVVMYSVLFIVSL